MIAELVSFYSLFALAPPTIINKVSYHPLVKANKNKFRYIIYRSIIGNQLYTRSIKIKQSIYLNLITLFPVYSLYGK